MSRIAYPSFRLLTSVVMLGLFSSAIIYAQEDTEFNTSFFGAEDTSVTNIHRFNNGNYVPPGRYNVDVFVNGTLKGRTDVEYVENDNDNTSLCITSDLKDLFDLKPEAFASKRSGDCQFAEQYIPEAKIRLDQGTLALNVEIPQALTVVRPRGYVPSSLWDNGVPAIFVNYSANHQTFKQGEYTSHSQYLYMNGGLNVGGWALRHNGGYSRTDGQSNKYQRGLTYLQKGIAPLNSELTLGDLTSDGTVADSVSMRGVSLGTDLRMLPQTQRGYAPRVSGSAHTNAIVSIFQNGNLIYQTSVPAGPFEINDLYPTGYSGELEVEIREADGRVRKFNVPYATLVPLMRPGQIKYQLAGGRYRYGSTVLKENVATGSLQYGLTNNITLNGGFIGHKNYRSGTAGLAFNTPIGAIAGDYTQARANLGGSSPISTGSSIRASYSLYVTPTKTNITLATYRYFSKGYYSLDETVVANQLELEGDRDVIESWRRNTLRPKHRYQLTMSQDLGEDWGAFYLSGSASNYWNYSGTNLDYNFSYGNRYKTLSYQIGFSQNREAGSNKSNKQLNLSFSLPLPVNVKATDNQGYYSNSTTFRNSGEHSFRQSYSNSVGQYHDLNYGLSSMVTNQNNISGTGSLNYRTNYGSLDASVSVDNQHSRQYSVGANGAVVLHQKGITLSDNVGGTFGIVHVKNGKGARLNNGLGKKLDVFGNAIIEHLTPYDYNRVGIDPTDSDINLEFDATEREVVPVANSTMLIDLNARRNTMVLFSLITDGNTTIPMGAEAEDSQGNVIGYVAQGGTLFANRLTQTQDRISIKWGNGENERCYFDYKLDSLDIDPAEGMINLDMKCMRGGW